MSAQVDLVLNDGQATPVAHTFSARGADMGFAKWTETTANGGILVGLPTIIWKWTDPTANDKASPSYKLEARIMVPVLETISGSDGGYTPAPRVAYSMFGKIELVSPARASAQNRKDLRAYVSGLMSHSVLTNAVNNLDFPN